MSGLNSTWDVLHQRLGHEAVAGPGHDDDASYEASGKATADWIEAAVGSFRGREVLDYGCGDGRVARHVAPRCLTLTCADASSVALARLWRLHGRQGIQVERLQDLPDLRFDAIYAWHVAFHNPRIWIFSFILEAHQRLRPGGRLVMNYCNFWHDFYLPVLRRKAEQGTWMEEFPHCMVSGTELVRFAGAVAGFATAEILDDRPDVLQPTLVCRKGEK